MIVVHILEFLKRALYCSMMYQLMATSDVVVIFTSTAKSFELGYCAN